MKYRRFISPDQPVSVIGLGTWQFGGEWGQDYSQKEVDDVVEACRETGINFIDTAECYGDGVSERLVGNSVKRDREKWIIATKFGHHFKAIGDRDQLWSAPEVLRQLEQSLNNLQTDYIDLYQFHSGDNSHFDNDELWTMLEKQKQAGKIRHIGISLTSREDIRDNQALKVASVGADAVQVVYSRIDRGAEETVLPECRKKNLSVLARVPLASGFLSGKYETDTTFPAGDYRSGFTREKIGAMVAEVRRIQSSEAPKEVPLASWALSWCLKHEAIACVIPGARNPIQLRGNASSVDLLNSGHPLDVDMN